MSSENYSQFMALPEYCPLHPTLLIEIFCSCNGKLCAGCLKDHYHESLSYQSIKEKVSKFHCEVNQCLQFTLSHLARLRKAQFGQQEEVARLTQSLISDLKQTKEKVKELISTRYFITYDILVTFHRENYKEKVKESVLNYFRKLIKVNKGLVDTLLLSHNESRNTPTEIRPKHCETKPEPPVKNLVPSPDVLQLRPCVNTPVASSRDALHRGESPLNPRNKAISITNVMNVINMSLPKEGSVLSSISPGKMNSNKENVDPRVEEVYISQFDTRQMTPKKDKRDAFFDAIRDYTPSDTPRAVATVHVQPILKQSKTKKKQPYNSVKSEPVFYTLAYEGQTGFLESSSGGKTVCSNLKIVCVTCRDKFSVSKDQAAWRNRCDVCTENYEY